MPDYVACSNLYTALSTSNKSSLRNALLGSLVWLEAEEELCSDVLTDLSGDVRIELCFPLQATYAYMKAAYLSMLSPDDRQTFGESEIALFRFGLVIALLCPI